jgi:hypothetical protein
LVCGVWDFRELGEVHLYFLPQFLLGNLVAGLFAGEFDANAVAANPQLLVDLFRYWEVWWVRMPILRAKRADKTR